MKSSCKQGPVIISDSDSDDNLQPLQRKAICEALPEFVEEVAATEERHPVSLPGNQQDEFPLVSAGTSRRHFHACHICCCTGISPNHARLWFQRMPSQIGTCSGQL